MSDRVVTPAAQVGSYVEKIDAERATLHGAGVKGVTVQILIKPEVSSRLVKSDIGAALKRREKKAAQDM